MAEPASSDAWRVEPRAKWLHDLRNAVNMAGVTVSMGQRFLADDDHDGALGMFAEAADAVGRCRALLVEANEVLGIGRDAGAMRPASADATARCGSTPDR